MARSRLDAELVRRGLASSRVAAQRLISDGHVRVSGLVAEKAATQVDHSAPLEVVEPQDSYVSRGAHKLIGALRAFRDHIPSLEGQKCLDAGASTGGFTEVLLHEGAREVVSIDVGYNQLAWKLREDPRVTVMERTNVRHLTSEMVGEPPILVVADLSFISLTLVLPALVSSCPGSMMMLMVKPQFEAGREQVGAGGVVRDRGIRAQTVLSVARAAEDEGLSVYGVAASPLPGPSGNVEYFLLLKPNSSEGEALVGQVLQQAVTEAVETGPQDGIVEASSDGGRGK